jgi:hypothetical protein
MTTIRSTLRRTLISEASPAIDLSSIDVLIGYAALIDLLFLPYLRLLVMPLSLPVLLIWTLVRVNLELDEDTKLFLLLGGGVIASVIVGTMFRDVPTVTLNVKRAFQLLSTFVYFFYFRWLASRTVLRLSPILTAFVIYHTLWLIFFLLMPTVALGYLLAIYGSVEQFASTYALSLRFPYAFSDPNTAAYFFLVAIGFLVTRSHLSRIRGSLLAVVILVTLIVCQSRGALLAAGCMVLVLLWQTRHWFREHPKVVLAIGLVLGLCVIMAVSWVVTHGDLVRRLTVLIQLQDRLTGDQSTHDGRASFYRWVISTYAPLPIGFGYAIIRNGDYFAPHSDQLRLMYCYGFIAWLALLGLVFRDMLRRGYLFLIPAFVAFSINTLVDEQKILGLVLIALGITRSFSQSRRARAITT